MKRGDIFLVNYDPVIGSEIAKTRPAVIIQNNKGNQASNNVICAAITSKLSKHLPVTVDLSVPMFGLDKPSTINATHIRTLDKSRLIHKIGTCSDEVMGQVDRALKISLALK